MSYYKKYFFLLLNLIVFISVIMAVYLHLKNPDTTRSRGSALIKLQEILPESKKDLGQLILDNYHEYRANTVRWSFAYFSCIFGAAIFSAFSALILKLDLLQDRKQLRNDIAAILSTLAALFITLSTVGDFQRKWQTNRMAASGMEILAYELLKSDSKSTPKSILSEIQRINLARNQEIIGRNDTDTEKENNP